MRINVTKTYLPPEADYAAYLRGIWDRNILTNQGPLVAQLETDLAAYLKVPFLQFCSNGTLAIQLAIKALGIEEGEIITTPFSYVATTSAILWERCQPVFVDIDPKTFCIDASKIEAAITAKTKAILGVHVFGYPCDIEAIEAIGRKHNIPVVYDGAHAFAVQYKGKPLLSYGDISICSFHATKLFHTVEGGAVICHDAKLDEKVRYAKAFGHDYDEHVTLGINAKNSEFHAAMGLSILPYMNEILAERKELSDYYDAKLSGLSALAPMPKDAVYNYAYYPVLFENEEQLLRVFGALNDADIYPRRYFYPSLNTLPYLEKFAACPVSQDISSRIACLPLYCGLAAQDMDRIIHIIQNNIRGVMAA